MDTTPTPNEGISRSGLILGAAGIAGVSALAALPGIAHGAPDASTASGPLHGEADVAVKRHHPHYHRANFERANAIVTLSNGSESMTCRVVHVDHLRHADGASRGSKDWAGGFSVLMQRTKGAKLGHGTFTATANGKRFPLLVSEVSPNVYQAIVNRFTPVGS